MASRADCDSGPFLDSFDAKVLRRVPCGFKGLYEIVYHLRYSLGCNILMSFLVRRILCLLLPRFEDQPFVGLRPPLLKAIYSYGFKKPSALQKRAIPAIVARGNRDVVVQAHRWVREVSERGG